MITNRSKICIIAWLVISFFPHELGHVIALWMLGVPAHIEFLITPLGPVFRATWVYRPVLSDIWFSAFFGPFFAGIVMMAIGKVKSEAYFAGGFQLLYAPFELLSWVLFDSTGVLNMYVLVVIMVVIPAIPVFDWGLDRIEERNK